MKIVRPIQALVRLALACTLSAAVSGPAARAEDCGPAPADYAYTKLASPDQKTLSLADGVQRRVSEERFSALGLGDSIMFGWPPDLLSEALGTPVLDAAVGGGTDTLLWQLSAGQWSNQSPRYVLVLVGTNNLGRGACETYWGIEGDVAALRQKFPGTTIIVVSILPRGQNLQDSKDRIAQVNDNLRKASSKGQHLFLDAHDAFLCDSHTPCELFDSTNLHLTRAGYILLTDRLKKLLSANGDKPAKE